MAITITMIICLTLLGIILIGKIFEERENNLKRKYEKEILNGK